MSSENPLLQVLRNRIPGETFKLPSQGLFYVNGELAPDVVNGEVHIYPMTTYDEITMKTPDKLFSGKAITEVFSRCVPQILKPMELLSKDVDFILMCLRMMSFGDNVAINYTHWCPNTKQHTYDVEQRKLIAETRQIDPTLLNTVCTYTSESGQIVKLRPALFKHMIAMYQVVSLQKTKLEDDIDGTGVALIHEKMIDLLAGMILAIDEVTDPNQIREWLTTVPAGWVTKISEHSTELGNWGVDAVVTKVCKDCGEEMKLEVPVNPVGFFM